jgi:hypothetical protein
MIQRPIEDFYFFKKTIDEKGLSRPNSATLVEHQSIEVSRSLNFQYFARHALKKFCCVFLHGRMLQWLCTCSLLARLLKVPCPGSSRAALYQIYMQPGSESPS